MLAVFSLLGKCHVITSIPFRELDNASNIVDYLDVMDAKNETYNIAVTWWLGTEIWCTKVLFNGQANLPFF
jgi:hypothetical protein